MRNAASSASRPARSRSRTWNARRAPPGAARFGAVLTDARAARDAWQAMADIIDAKAGADAPSTTAVRDLVSGIIEIVSRYAPADAAGNPGCSCQRGVRGTGCGVLGRIAVSPGQIASREDALRALGQIADFFRRSEPHSPLSYTLDEAVRRGRMTWPELLAEVVADTDTRNTILNTLGIRPPPPEASE